VGGLCPPASSRACLVDQAIGSGLRQTASRASLAVETLKQLARTSLRLFAESDGTFPNHHPRSHSARNLHDLQAAVKKEKAELGIAFDGDGDRNRRSRRTRRARARGPAARVVRPRSGAPHGPRTSGDLRRESARRCCADVEEGRSPAGHVEDGHSLHQAEDERNRRPARRRN